MGGFVALLADFPPAEGTSPSVSLGEAGERCGKSLQEHGCLPQLLLQGFWITSRVFLLSLGAMPETQRSPCRKPAFSGFLSPIGIALNYSGDKAGFSSRDFGDSTLDDENNFLTPWKSFAPRLWPVWPLPRLNKSH